MNIFSSSAPPLPPFSKSRHIAYLPAHHIEILILVPLTDASKIYHFIRGQDTIKLYVIFNALEVRYPHIFIVDISLSDIVWSGIDRLQTAFVRRSDRISLTVYLLAIDTRVPEVQSPSNFAYSTAIRILWFGNTLYW